MLAFSAPFHPGDATWICNAWIALASRARAARQSIRILLGILQGIPDQEKPDAIVARLMDAVPPGSYLAISQSRATSPLRRWPRASSGTTSRPLPRSLRAPTLRSAGSSRAWSWSSPASCRCTGGALQPRTWAPAANWPFTPESDGNRNRGQSRPCEPVRACAVLELRLQRASRHAHARTAQHRQVPRRAHASFSSGRYYLTRNRRLRPPGKMITS